jgi:predicted alpha/beta-fold hydrolase
MHSKSIYHGSSFEDLKKVFEYLTYRNPNSPMIGIGFSLSGGIILKMLSQIQVRDKLLLDYVISICPVTDFKESSKQIHQGINKIFERYFINLCIKMARRRFVEYNDLEPLPKFRKNMSLYEFDDIYTSKEAGYNNADEYYKASSSIDSIHQIRIKTDILVALDDPIIDNEKLLKLDLNKNIRINYTKYGGHMGYLQWPLGKRWLDTQILSWVKSHIIGSKLQNINKFKKI